MKTNSCSNMLTKHEEVAETPYIYENSAPPPFERTARRQRMPPPGRAILFYALDCACQALMHLHMPARPPSGASNPVNRTSAKNRRKPPEARISPRYLASARIKSLHRCLIEVSSMYCHVWYVTLCCLEHARVVRAAPGARDVFAYLRINFGTSLVVVGVHLLSLVLHPTSRDT